jgi:hypothetical protein
MAHRTGLYREVEDRLGSSLEEFILGRRAENPKPSWRALAREVEDRTGIALTDETLRVWFTFERRAPVEATA